MRDEEVPNPASGYTDPIVRDLVAAAFETIRDRYVLARHQIAAAVLDADGRVHLGLHVDAMVGRAAVCAEAGALSAARLVTSASLLAVAAVRFPKPTEPPLARVVPPCGLCRELLLDHAPHISVVLPHPEDPLIPLACLLPHKYVGTKWPAPLTQP
ncbi:hypothetical protein ACFW6V_28275 [Streptomyces sp. NPDC058734]|uniref:hypothetical protein n=1 Tax=Streptomyces sp. NPDC058734 TaxID=3346615 RepID=UPI00369B56AF